MLMVDVRLDGFSLDVNGLLLFEEVKTQKGIRIVDLLYGFSLDVRLDLVCLVIDFCSNGTLCFTLYGWDLIGIESCTVYIHGCNFCYRGVFNAINV